MSGDIVVRRATADDYESAINVIDDMWDGNDYLPTLYHVLLQTKTHVFYVAEINSRVVKTNLPYLHAHHSHSERDIIRQTVS